MLLRRSLEQRGKRHDHLAGVRLWLATSPSQLGIDAYDDWVVQRPLHQPNDTRFVKGRGIMKALGLGWPDVRQVARRELALTDAAKGRATAPTPNSGGPHDLVSVADVMALMMSTRDHAERETHKASFPRPVLIASRRRLWMRGDVQAYLAGKDVPMRQVDELHSEYLSLAEMQSLTGLGLSSLERGAKGIPAPIARVGGVRLWLRAEVEALVPPGSSLGRKFRRETDV